MADEVKKIVRERKVKLSNDADANVTNFACARINKAVSSIRVFGNCYGSKYNWTPEQIETAEQALTDAVVQAMDNIRVGKEIVSAGITL